MKIAAIKCSTNNLGDDMQAMAARQLLPSYPDYWVDKDALDTFEPGEPTKLIINGFMRSGKWPRSRNVIPLVIGMHAGDSGVFGNESVHWLSQRPVGCRDQWTTEQLRARGVNAYCSGCLTMTLSPPSTAVKKGVVAVDSHYEGAEVISQYIKSGVVDGRDEMLHNFLSCIYEASMVVTVRLHAALACLAFQKPCWLLVKDYNDPRFTGYLAMLNTVSAHSLTQSDRLPVPRPATDPNGLINRIRSVVRTFFET